MSTSGLTTLRRAKCIRMLGVSFLAGCAANPNATPQAPAPDLSQIWSAYGPSILLVTLLLSLPFVVWYAIRVRRASRKKWSEIDSENAQTGASRHLGFAGAMLEELFARYPSDRRAAAVALIRVLPDVKSDDAYLFTSRHRALLRGILRRREPELVCAALAALTQIGDDRDVDEVRFLQTSTLDSQIRCLASTCHTAIEQRIESERSRDTLLRPSAEHSDSTLLRAASGSTGSGDSVMLRAADSE